MANNKPLHVTIYSPFDGIVADLKETEDITYADRLVGDGMAVVPSTSKVYAPFDGKIASVYPTGHAYIIDHEGFSILIHIGIDTVMINQGKSSGDSLIAFKPMVKKDDIVKAGDVIAEVDLQYLKDHNFKTITPIIALNECMEGYILTNKLANGTIVNKNSKLCEITKK